MAAFPRTYGVVKSGQVQTATVHDADELFALRAELELTLRFGAGATEQVLGALDERMRRLRAEGTGDVASALIQLTDMRSILLDGMAPANVMAARCMDADFPTLCGALDMDEIKNESDQFHQDVAAELSASGVPDADALAEAFAEATAETGIGDTPVQDGPEIASEPLEGVSMEPVPAVPNGVSPAETAAQVAEANLAAAEDLLAQIEAGQDLLAAAVGSTPAEDEPVSPASESQIDTAAAPSCDATVGGLDQVQDEIAAMSKALSSTAAELGSLTETVAAAVGAVDTGSSDEDLAAAMADMLAPTADASEPAEETPSTLPTEATEDVGLPEATAVPSDQEVVPEAAADDVLAAVLAETIGNAAGVAPEVGTGDASIVADPALTAAEPAITEAESQSPMAANELPTVTEEVSVPAVAESPIAEPPIAEPAAAQPAVPGPDPLADLLKPAESGVDDAVQAEAFAALLKEPTADDDAALAAMLTLAAADTAPAESSPAGEVINEETPVEETLVSEAPVMAEIEERQPQVSEPALPSPVASDEAAPTTRSEPAVSEAAVAEPAASEQMVSEPSPIYAEARSRGGCDADIWPRSWRFPGSA